MCSLQVEQKWSGQISDQERRVQPEETQWTPGCAGMKKPVYLETVEFAMLQDLANKSHLKPEQVLKNLIQETYGKHKR